MPSSDLSQPVLSPGLGSELYSAARAASPRAHCTFATDIPPQGAQYSSWPTWCHPDLQAFWESNGVSQLFLHQRQCADSAWSGHHTIISTGTSSGKSLGYLLPILTRLIDAPAATALYITPTKALGADQLTQVGKIVSSVDALRTVAPAPYDGDTPTDARGSIRDHSRFVFTNPDMLHISLLAHHQQWTRFLRNLAFIVVDECHSYRGIFGAHVALVLRRLLRLAESYGAHPVVIAASATIALPHKHLQRLIGRPARAVTTDTAPTGTRTIMLWQPGILDDAPAHPTTAPRFPAQHTSPHQAPARRSALSEAATLMAAFIAEGARTLSFFRTRKSAEIAALQCAENLSAAGRVDFASRVAAYRAGYLPEERRALERGLDDGSLLGLATTNALELGIDVGTLDAVITVGFPGTIASFWQQAGRAGRRGQSSVVVFIARDEPLDTYLVTHPDALLGKPIEEMVFNPHNPYVLRGHLYCAAVEKPLSDADVDALGASDVVGELEEAGLLRRRRQGWFAVPRLAEDELPTPENAHSLVNVRGTTGSEILIVTAEDGRLLGTVDAGRARTQVHPGAVYLHQGESYVVDELDLDSHVALVHSDSPDYTTMSLHTTDIRILDTPNEQHTLQPAPGFCVTTVEVSVTQKVTGYMVRSRGGEVLEHVPLDLPAETLLTRAVAYTIDPVILEELQIPLDDVPGALHAAEHAAIGLLPLFAACDRWDLGGVSTALHADTGLPTVFVYDGYPGGAGFADLGFQRFREWITATYDTVRDCPCESGCPSCIQSPKCGNGNDPLSKAGAIALLEGITQMVSVTQACTTRNPERA